MCRQKSRPTVAGRSGVVNRLDNFEVGASGADPPQHGRLPDARDPPGLRVQRDRDPEPRGPGAVRRHGAPMKLKPTKTYPPAGLKGRVPRELHTALTAYAAYYRETT